MKPVMGLGLLLALGGCASVEVTYDAPAVYGDASGAAAQAKQGLSYYTLQKIHVAVGPVDDAASPGGDKKPATPPQPPAAPAQNSESGGAGAGQKAGQAQAAAAPAKPDPAQPAAVKPDAAKPADTAPSPSVFVVNGKKWGATLTARSDAGHGFMMGGTNGFWKKTTISATRAANSDLATVVTVKAENLTATRLGQLATVLGYFISPAKAANPEAGGGAPSTDPKPFDFDFELSKFGEAHAIVDSDWTWSVRTPGDDTAKKTPEPEGAVPFETFKGVMSRHEKANYFPVPACLNVDLVLRRPGSADVKIPLVLATAEIVRLEPLPLDGSLSLSAICSATVQGATKADSYDEVFNDLAAVQAAYTQVKTGKAAGAAADKAKPAAGQKPDPAAKK